MMEVIYKQGEKIGKSNLFLLSIWKSFKKKHIKEELLFMKI